MAPDEVCAAIAARRNSHIAARSRRVGITSLNSNNSEGGSENQIPRHMYRAKEARVATPSIAAPGRVRNSASRRRCPVATSTNLGRPPHPPHYRQQSRRGNKALKRNCGRRREFRISQRFMVSDAAESWPDGAGAPAVTEVRRVSHKRRGRPLNNNSRRERKGVFSRWHLMRAVETRRPAHIARRQQKSNRKNNGP